MTDRHSIAAALNSALIDGDKSTLVPLLADDILWGDCHSAAQAVEHIDAIFATEPDLSGHVITLEDRFVVDVDAVVDGETVAASVAVFDDNGRVVEMHGPTSAGHARSVGRAGPFVAGAQPVTFSSVAPVFPVRDVDAAIGVYRALGFAVESYDGGAFYAFATRGDVQIHLGHVGDVDPKTNMSAAYLYVSDAKALFAEWKAAATDGRLHAPTDTDYGLCEGAYVDTDGNLLRFGSPI